jgi:UDP-2-acetamido-3-amino-2,3-dideoxy-glucuronate N-acetyltransferase
MIKIHSTADVSKNVKIGQNTSVWHQAQIRENVIIGDNCIIAKGAYIDNDVIIGNNVKIQNYASIYHITQIEDSVFIGPYVCITNDLLPRAINPNGSLKSNDDWNVGKSIIRTGASLGAGTIVTPGIEIGSFAMTGAGSLVAENIPSQALVYGHPAKIQGWVCKCGSIIAKSKKKPTNLLCKKCQTL